jgi:hypothetical protein
VLLSSRRHFTITCRPTPIAPECESRAFKSHLTEPARASLERRCWAATLVRRYAQAIMSSAKRRGG